MGRRAIDMTGWKMWEHGVDGSRVTVVKRIDDYVGSTGVREPQWECLCDCGNIFTATSNALRSGQTRSCGCLLKEAVHNRRFKDLTGMKFGKWTVSHRADDNIDNSGNHHVMWHCVCGCGNEKDVRGSNLISGLSKSCGCLQKEDKKGTNFDKTLREYDENGNIIGRICSCCKRMLPIDNYYKYSNASDGLSNMCKYCQARSVHGRYQVYRQGAKNRNLDFEITKDEFDVITQKSCYYCGDYANDYFGKPYSGIDRVNSCVGYVIDNVVPCCTMCNRMKLDYTTSDWLAKMRQILYHMDCKGDLDEKNK